MHVKGIPWQYLLPSASGKIYIYISIYTHSTICYRRPTQCCSTGRTTITCWEPCNVMCCSTGTYMSESIGRERTHTSTRFHRSREYTHNRTLQLPPIRRFPRCSRWGHRRRRSWNTNGGEVPAGRRYPCNEMHARSCSPPACGLRRSDA